MAHTSGEPLTNCPACRYDLTGLPADHRCPECGFEYDETTIMWHGSRRWWITAFLWVVLLCMLAAIVIDLSGLSRFTGDPRARFVGVAFAVGVLWLVFDWYWSRPFVAMAKYGIVFRDIGRRRIRTVAWTEFWMPEPGARMAIPPWRVEVARRPTSVLGRLKRILASERGYFHSVTRIYLPPTHPRLFPLRYLELPLRGMTRHQKREVMTTIWTRWRSAQSPLREA